VLVSLPTAAARPDAAVERVFEGSFRRMVTLFEETLENEGRGPRDRGVLMATLCMGAHLISRALGSGALASKVRRAALREALELAGSVVGTHERGVERAALPTKQVIAPGTSQGRERPAGSIRGMPREYVLEHSARHCLQWPKERTAVGSQGDRLLNV
jgi:hypothetical protein